MKKILFAIVSFFYLLTAILIMATGNIFSILSFFVVLIASILYILFLNNDKFEESIFKTFSERYKDVLFFKIDYKKNIIYFLNGEISESTQMSLQEFAIRVLKINATSSEIIAMYIGKLDFDTYKENNPYTIKTLKKNKKYMYGYIVINKTH